MEPASDNPPAPTSSLRRLVRSLRNLSALGLLTLSFGVLGLWVRSRDYEDVSLLTGPFTFNFISGNGRIELVRNYSYDKSDSELQVLFSSRAIGPMLEELRTIDSGTYMPRPWGWKFEHFGVGWNVYGPHWFIAIVLAALAFALKPKPRLKFSLADLLVLMTFSAVLVAGVASLTRLAS